MLYCPLNPNRHWLLPQLEFCWIRQLFWRETPFAVWLMNSGRLLIGCVSHHMPRATAYGDATLFLTRLLQTSSVSSWCVLPTCQELMRSLLSTSSVIYSSRGQDRLVYRVLFACHFLARVLLAMSIDSSRILLNKQAGVNVVTSSRKRPCARLAV